MKDDTEDMKILKELGISEQELGIGESTSELPVQHQQQQLHPALAFGICTFAVFNVTLLLSLPPVLRGRGAPYLPTFQKNMDAMFIQLRNHPEFIKKRQQQQKDKKLIFVDLGSGDGRIVFRAMKEKIFTKSIGYEINPLLHIFASIQRIIRGPQTWKTTQFYIRDLWNVDLSHADVIALYGLGPIMKDLGHKLQNELKPGSFVLSNVFSFPDWKPIGPSKNGTFVYHTPYCWQKQHQKQIIKIKKI